jgi:hypothetical protein
MYFRSLVVMAARDREVGKVAYFSDHKACRRPCAHKKAGNYRSRIRVQNDQPFVIASGDKQAMSRFVKRHSDILLDRPGRDHVTFFAVNEKLADIRIDSENV